MSNSTLAIEALSGATGAVIALVATYPLIRVSTNQAVDKKSSPSSEYKPLTVLQEIIKIYENEGAGGLFRGVQPGVVGTLISQGIYFYIYAAIRTLFVKPAKKGSPRQYQEISVGASLLTASIAGSANVLLTNPIWVVVTRMQTSSLSFRQVVAQLHDEAAGVTAFWKGVVPSLVMVSNPTITYALYEWFVARWLTAKRAKAVRQYRSPQSVKLTGTEVFCLSACAKLGATVLTYPLLLVKNRMQVAKNPQDTHSGTFQTIISIYKGEGIWGFFKGIRAKMLQSIFSAALLFMIKEQLQEASSTALNSLYRTQDKNDD